MAALTFDKENKLIIVDDPQTEVTVQDLSNQIRDFEDELNNLDFLKMMNATGKDDLGGGNQTGITLTLLNDWRVKFADRAGPATISCKVSGGNLIAINSFSNNPIAPASFVQVTIEVSLSPSIASRDDTNVKFLVESNRPDHIGYGNQIYWNPEIGDDGLTGESPENAVKTFVRAHDIASDGNNDVIFILGDPTTSTTIITERITITKDTIHIRGHGPGMRFQPITATDGSPIIDVQGVGFSLESLSVFGSGSGSDDSLVCSANGILIRDVHFQDARNNSIIISSTNLSRFEAVTSIGAVNDGFNADDITNSLLNNCRFLDSGGDGIHFVTPTTQSKNINMENVTSSNNTGFNLRIDSGVERVFIADDCTVASNGGGRLQDNGIGTIDSEVRSALNSIQASAGRSLDI